MGKTLHIHRSRACGGEHAAAPQEAVYRHAEDLDIFLAAAVE